MPAGSPYIFYVELGASSFYCNQVRSDFFRATWKEKNERKHQQQQQFGMADYDTTWSPIIKAGSSELDKSKCFTAYLYNWCIFHLLRNR